MKEGIIESASYTQNQYISQIFPRPKRAGGIRIILNLSKLNIYVEYKHFKMESLNSALLLMKPNCFMASIDLRDAYFLVNVDKGFRKFLRFIWRSKLFEFTCLPMGLACSPRIFTKIMKPIFERLRKNGLSSIFYLDDSWLLGSSFEDCKRNVDETANILTNAGFIINKKKSVMIPSQKIEFLGFWLNSCDMTVSLPHDKIVNISELCEKILTDCPIKIRFLARFIGVLVSCLPAVEHGQLYYRYLEINKIKALKLEKGNFDAFTQLEENAKLEVLWWKCNINDSFRFITISSPELTIHTDASQLGWGAVLDDCSCGGQWTEEESLCHINVLELKAVFFGLSSLMNEICNKHIRVKSDNTTTVTYINNKGGVKSLQCHVEARKIWEWAIARGNQISAEHLPGSKNVLADKASRVFSDNTEWALSMEIFENVAEVFGPFDIDLFASRLNYKVNYYCSWKPDPLAAFIDAFGVNWGKFNFYAYPPFSLVMRTLKKVCEDGASGVLICPLWPTQPWFPSLMQMLVDTPIVLPLNILYLPFKREKSHEMDKNLRLMACPVSGVASLTEAFRERLPMSDAPLGAEFRVRKPNSILENGFISVISGKLIPFKLMK